MMMSAHLSVELAAERFLLPPRRRSVLTSPNRLASSARSTEEPA